MTNLLVINDTVFFQQADKTFTGLDLHTGEVKVRTRPLTGYVGPLDAIDDAIIVFQSDFDKGILYAYDPHGFHLIWSKTLYLNSQTPWSDNSRVIIQTAGNLLILREDSKLSAINVHTGESAWEQQISKDFQFVINGDRIFLLPEENSTILSLRNSRTGDTIWASPIELPASENRLYRMDDGAIVLSIFHPAMDEPYDPFRVNQSPTTITITRISNDNQPIVTSQTQLLTPENFDSDGVTMDGKRYLADSRIIDARSKDVSHHHPIPLRDPADFIVTGDGLNVGSNFFPLISGNLSIFSVYGDSSFYNILELTSGTKIVWRSLPADSGILNAIVAIKEHNDSILIGTSGGQVECLDSATGKSRWRYAFPVPVIDEFEIIPFLRWPYLYTEDKTVRKFQQTYKANIQRSGYITLSADQSTAPAELASLLTYHQNFNMRRHHDPQPWNPYKMLPVKKAMAAFMSLIILMLIAFSQIKYFHLPTRKTAILTASAFLGILSLMILATTSILVAYSLFFLVLATKLLLFRELYLRFTAREYKLGAVWAVAIIAVAVAAFFTGLHFMPDSPAVM